MSRLEEELDVFLAGLRSRSAGDVTSRDALERLLEASQLEQTLYDRFLEKIVKQVRGRVCMWRTAEKGADAG